MVSKLAMLSILDAMRYALESYADPALSAVLLPLIAALKELISKET